jgi:hypothetical protein
LIEPASLWRSDLFEGSGVPVIEEAWQWNAGETHLRDYYANALLTFEEVQARGWPERIRSEPDAGAVPARSPE